MKTGLLAPWVALCLVSASHAKVCSIQDAQAADLMVDRLESWHSIEQMWSKFRHCDDGSISEGTSEAVARLLVDRWSTLPEFAALAKRNPALKRFVLAHVNTTLDSADLARIGVLSSSSCTTNLASLCADLHSAAVRAGK